jgi:hypothetical protein
MTAVIAGIHLEKHTCRTAQEFAAIIEDFQGQHDHIASLAFSCYSGLHRLNCRLLLTKAMEASEAPDDIS